MAFRENIRAKQEIGFGLENALAAYVRRRWPDKAIPYVMREWGLSESEASKVVYAHASKNTLKKLLHHKRGGFGLFLHLIEEATCTKLEDYISNQAKRAENERRTWEAEERRLATLQARVSGDDRLDWRAAEQARPARAEDAALGSGARRKALSVVRPEDRS